MKPLDLNDLRFKYRNKFYNIVLINNKRFAILLDGYVKLHPKDNGTCVEVTLMEWDDAENEPYLPGWYYYKIYTDIKLLPELLRYGMDEGTLKRKGTLAYKALNQWWKYKYKNNLYKDQK